MSNCRGIFGRFVCDGDCNNCSHPLDCESFDKGLENMYGKTVEILVQEKHLITGKVIGYTSYYGIVAYINQDNTCLDNPVIEIQLALKGYSNNTAFDFRYITIDKNSKALVVIREDDAIGSSIMLNMYNIDGTSRTKENRADMVARAFDSYKSNQIVKMFDSLDEFRTYINSFKNKEKAGNKEMSMTTEEKKKYGYGYGTATEDNYDDEDDYGDEDTGYYEDESSEVCMSEETYNTEMGKMFLLGAGMAFGVMGIAKIVRMIRKR